MTLSLIAGAPLAFEADLGSPRHPNATDRHRHGRGHRQRSAQRDQPQPGADGAAARRGSGSFGRAGRGVCFAVRCSKPSETTVRRAKRARPRRTSRKVPHRRGRVASGARAAAAAPKAAMRPQASQPREPMALAASASRRPRLRPRRESRRDRATFRALAAVALEGGATRYDLPTPITVPDKSATMVMLLSKRVPGESIFLFAPDYGVPDSQAHPFRVARFTNKSGGLLERGPIAIFEEGAFLGQGMVDPLPEGATTTVPFALERSLAVETQRTFTEEGARLAKIESGVDHHRERLGHQDALPHQERRGQTGQALGEAPSQCPGAPLQSAQGNRGQRGHRERAGSSRQPRRTRWRI